MTNLKYSRVVCLILPLVFSIFFSCEVVYRISYGIKKEKSELEISRIIKFAKSNKIDTFYTIKGNYLSRFVENSKVSNDFFQPLQVRIYNSKNDSLIGYIVNCKVGGFPNLKWNRYGFFDSLPPKAFIKYDSLTTFNSDKQFIRNINLNDSLSFPIQKGSKYTINIYFSYYMNRQTKLLLKQARQTYSNKEGVKINYINSDRLMSNINYSK
jgi:hypothetical protein